MEWNTGNQLRQPRRRTTGERVSRAVFGLIFLAFGCGFLYLVLLRPLGQIIAARHWVATPAQVVSSAVQSKGSTHRVAIRYTYTVNNQRYESSRYDFVGGSSSGRAGKTAIVRQYPLGSKLTCFVNPDDPAMAVIDRGLQPMMWLALLPSLFVAIGIIFLATAFRKAPVVVPAPTVAPWQNRKDWAAGRIESTDRRNFVMTCVFAAIWNAVSWAALCVAWHDWAQTNSPAKWIIFLFPAVGVGLLGAAIYSWLKWLKFGHAVFEMASVPGVVGGALEGTIKLGRFLRFPAGVKVRLCCVHQITVGSGKNRSTSEMILWESERLLSDTGGTDAISVLFAIPVDAKETNGANLEDQILWRLTAKAELPGVDLSETFVVPVCNIAPTPAQAAIVQRARAAEADELAHYERPASSRIRIQTVATGMEFYFPAARNPGTAANLTVFTMIWIGTIFGQVHFQVPVIFPIVTGLVGVGLLIAVVNLWFGTTCVVATKTGITITKRLAGISRCRAVAGSEIDAITVKQGMTAGTAIYHDIKIRMNSGQEITAGGSIRDYQEVRWLASEMARGAVVTYRL